MMKCTNCGYEGDGTYCAGCGKEYAVKRITINSLIHEVIHTFTHFDKGFGYTLKQLALHPGLMQRNYLEGERSRHQKPFSMFFICATITGIALYWLIKPSLTPENHFDEMHEHFLRHYFVFLQAALLPIYAFSTWIFFRSAGLNYAETLVLFCYALSFMLLLTIPVNLLNFKPNHINTAWIEIPLFLFYIVWTNTVFFKNQPPWQVIIKSILNLILCYWLSNFLQNQLIHLLM